MSDNDIIIIAQVEQEFEAVAAVAALKDAEIFAYYQPTPSDSRLGLPGSFGVPAGFDIYVSSTDKAAADEVLVSIGCIQPPDECSDEDSATEPASVVQKNEDNCPQTLEELMPENNTLAAVYRVLLAVLALAIFAGFVWLCDAAIEWVKTFFIR